MRLSDWKKSESHREDAIFEPRPVGAFQILDAYRKYIIMFMDIDSLSFVAGGHQEGIAYWHQWHHHHGYVVDIFWLSNQQHLIDIHEQVRVNYTTFLTQNNWYRESSTERKSNRSGFIEVHCDRGNRREKKRSKEEGGGRKMTSNRHKRRDELSLDGK